MEGMRTDYRQYRRSRMDELEWIQLQRQEVAAEMARSRDRMRGSYQRLVGREEIPSGKWGKASYLLSKSGTILNGIRIGIRIGKAVNTLIKLRQTFSRKKKQKE